MACFLVSAAEAAAVTVASKIVEKNEKGTKEIKLTLDGVNVQTAHKIPFSQKLKWLSRLQWGGSLLLAFEHLWHGEIQPFFPFLTAMGDPADAAEMFHEMSTIGVGMACMTTLAWVGMLGVSAAIEKKAEKEAQAVTSAE